MVAKYLNCNEIVKEKLHLNLSKRVIKKKNIILEENSGDEILEAIKEILKKRSKITKLQRKFVSLLPRSLSFSYSPSLVCNSFLQKNSFFFKKDKN